MTDIDLSKVSSFQREAAEKALKEKEVKAPKSKKPTTTTKK